MDMDSDDLAEIPDKDKRWLKNLPFQVTGPLDAEKLDRYPRIENWLLTQKVVGFEMEYRQSRSGGPTHVAMLQFAALPNEHAVPPQPGKVLLLRTHESMIPETVMQVITDKHVTKITVCAGERSEHNARVQRSFGIGIAGLKDISEVAKEMGYSKRDDVGLKALCDFFEIPIINDKRMALTDWEATNLSSAQVRYAADKPWYTLEVWQRLEKERKERHHEVKQRHCYRPNQRR